MGKTGQSDNPVCGNRASPVKRYTSPQLSKATPQLILLLYLDAGRFAKLRWEVKVILHTLIVLAALLRFVPHAASFSPVFAVLLISGGYLRRSSAMSVAFAAFVIADLVFTPLVYHTAIGWTQLFVWLGFAAVATFGPLLKSGWGAKTIAVWGGPTAFLLIADFGVWLGSGMYPRTLSGLSLCYIAALPFYRNALLASILWTAVLLPAYLTWERHLSLRRALASGHTA